MEEDNKISITVCGDGGCGKSSITLRLVRSQWTSEYDPTIEDSYSVTREIDGQTYHLHLTDTAGQEEYRGLFSTSNLHSDAFLLVYDITSATTVTALSHFIDLIGMETEERLDRGAVPPVKMVVGNKCDLGKIEGMRKVAAVQGLDWARQNGCAFMETSAREMVNVEETFAIIVRRVVEARRANAASQGYALGMSGHAAAMTQPLTPVNEKADPTTTYRYGQNRDPKSQKITGRSFKAFIQRLKCW